MFDILTEKKIEKKIPVAFAQVKTDLLVGKSNVSPTMACTICWCSGVKTMSVKQNQFTHDFHKTVKVYKQVGGLCSGC